VVRHFPAKLTNHEIALSPTAKIGSTVCVKPRPGRSFSSDFGPFSGFKNWTYITFTTQWSTRRNQICCFRCVIEQQALTVIKLLSFFYIYNSKQVSEMTFKSHSRSSEMSRFDMIYYYRSYDPIFYSFPHTAGVSKK